MLIASLRPLERIVGVYCCSSLLEVHCWDCIVGSALRERIVGVKRWSEAASPLIRSLVIVDYLNRPSSPSPFGFLSVFYLTVTF